MGSMLNVGIFKSAKMYDYQAFCKKDVDISSSAVPNSLTTPLEFVHTALKWLAGRILYGLMQLNLNPFNYLSVYAQDYADYGDLDTLNETETEIPDSYEEPEFDDSEDDYFACETELNLYILQQDLFIKTSFQGEIPNEGGRNYYVKRIPNSNLIFIAINNTIPRGFERYTTDPIRITEEAKFEAEFINTTLLPCTKLDLNNMPRRRLTGCYNEHPLEHEIVDCGRATLARITSSLLIISVIITLL